MLTHATSALQSLRRAGDVIERVFDPAVPESQVRPDELRRLPYGGPARVAELLRAVPVASVRAPLVAALVTGAGVRRVRHALRAIAVRDAAPLINRGIAAFLLEQHGIDARARADQIPALAEALLVGSALLGSVGRYGELLPGLLAAPGVDVEAVLDRVERRRLAAVAPEALVYGPALANARAVGQRRRILARVARAGRAQAEGRLWYGPPPADGSGFTAWAFVEADDEHVVGLMARMDGHEILGVQLSPLLARARAEACAEAFRTDPALRRAPLVTLGAAASRAPTLVAAETEERERAAWLLSRLPDA